ncbi:MAG: hypothetical protein QOF90_1359, partial [Acetobacteraceae bacterium]|nr:hypothetical protein [Acetobacteraceae bacterium]
MMRITKRRACRILVATLTVVMLTGAIGGFPGASAQTNKFKEAPTLAEL